MKLIKKYLRGNFPLFLVAGSVFAVCVFAVCVFLPSLSGAQKSFDGEMKVGIIGPLSGPAKIWGRELERGMELAMEDINAKGGVKVEGKTYKVVVIAYDDKYKGAVAADAANTLIFKDKVRFIFGSIASACTLALQVITEPNNVLTFTNGFARASVSAEKKFSFRVISTSYEMSQREIPAMIKHNPHLKTAATFGPNDVTGTSVTEDYLHAIGNKLKVVMTEYYQRGIEDYYPMLTRLKMANPDLIVSCGSAPGDVAKIVKQARQLGIKVPIMGHTGSVENPDEFVSIAEKENVKDYYYGIGFYAADPDPLVQKFAKKYEKKYGETCYSYVSPCYYDALTGLAYAIEKVDSFGTEKVRDYFEKKMAGFVGVMGPMVFTGKDHYGIDHQRIMNNYLCTFRDGKQVVLEKLK